MNGSKQIQSHVRCNITYEPAESWLDVVMVVEAWVIILLVLSSKPRHVFHFSVWLLWFEASGIHVKEAKEVF